MFGGVNKVTLVGRLGADPELRHFQNGGQVVNLRVATSEGYKSRDGEWQERTEWHSVSVFADGLGDAIVRRAKKGTLVYLEGKLETRKWQDRDGHDRYSTEIVLRAFGGSFRILADGITSGDREEAAPRSSAGRGRRPAGAAAGQGHPGADLDDDIPF